MPCWSQNFRGEEAFWGVDTDPLFFVRIFVPAAIWINFYTKDVATTPKPSESLQSQIQFLKQTAEADQNPALKNVADHNAVLAAVANACKIFHFDRFFMLQFDYIIFFIIFLFEVILVIFF